MAEFLWLLSHKGCEAQTGDIIRAVCSVGPCQNTLTGRAHLTGKETRLGEEKWAGREPGGYTTHSQSERRAGESQTRERKEEAADTLERNTHQESISHEPAVNHAMLCRSLSFT